MRTWQAVLGDKWDLDRSRAAGAGGTSCRRLRRERQHLRGMDKTEFQGGARTLGRKRQGQGLPEHCPPGLLVRDLEVDRLAVLTPGPAFHAGGVASRAAGAVWTGMLSQCCCSEVGLDGLGPGGVGGQRQWERSTGEAPPREPRWLFFQPWVSCVYW